MRNLFITSWSKLLLAGTAVSAMLGYELFPIEQSSELLSSYVIYVLVLGISSAMLFFVPDFTRYKNRQRLHIADTDDFPVVQVVVAGVLVPLFGYVTTLHFNASLWQMAAVALAVVNLAVTFLVARSVTLLQMVIAVIDMLFLAIGSIYLVLLLYVPVIDVYAVALTTLLLLGFYVEWYVWYAISFLESEYSRRSIVRTTFVSISALMVFGVTLFLLLRMTGVIV